MLQMFIAVMIVGKTEKFLISDHYFDLITKTCSIPVYLIEAVWPNMIKTLTHQISVLQ